MFPISISGAIRLRDLGNPTPYAARVQDRLVDLLHEANARDVAVDGEILRFKMGFFGAGAYHPLASIDGGMFQIEIEDTAPRVRYRLSTLHLLILITGPLVLFSGIMMFNRAVQDAWFAVLGWLWVFGLNYLIRAVRTRLWLKRRLKEVVE